jgi:hypothetical protein
MKTLNKNFETRLCYVLLFCFFWSHAFVGICNYSLALS